MSPLAPNQAARRVVRDLFGSTLAQQQRGFYVCLELLAVLRGQHLAGERLLDPVGTVAPFIRVSHDFARRLAVDTLSPSDDGYVAVDAGAFEPLQALLQSVSVRIPGQRKVPEWFGLHLYPYVGELVHYDAVRGRGNRKPSLERYVFRGAGILAHEMLREDPDPNRLDQMRRGLTDLVADSNSALGKIASALSAHDYARDTEPWAGDVEESVETQGDLTKWPELLRVGVANIVDRSEAPAAQRVENLMHWVPYCIARHSLELAVLRAGNDSRPIVVDLQSAPGPLRSASRASLDNARWTIVEALQTEAEEARDGLGPEDPDRPAFDGLIEHRERLVKGPRAFITETLAAVGALNATTGRRWFTLHLPLLETFVHAMLEGDQEMELERFMSEVLHDRLDLVIDGRMAARHGLGLEIDLADFDTNAQAAARALRGLGLLTEYSDSTRMVGTGVLT